MQTNNFVADVTLTEGAASFTVNRLTIEGTNDPARDLLDSGVMYADCDALQMVIAGKLRVEFAAVQVRLEMVSDEFLVSCPQAARL